MRVRVLTQKPGYAAGGVVEVDDALATAWIGSGDAERVIERQPEGERATAEPQGETAVTQPRRSRRG